MLANLLPWLLPALALVVGAAIGVWLGRRRKTTTFVPRRDRLTGLANRRGLADAVRSQFAFKKRYATPFSLALFQVEATQERDRQPGRLEETLQTAGGLIERHCRETELVARYGKDQFAVVLPHTGLHGALVSADRIQELLTTRMKVRVSGGVTVALDGDTLDTLFTRVEDASLGAHAAGPNRIFEHTGLEMHLAGHHLGTDHGSHAVAKTEAVAVAAVAQRVEGAALNPPVWTAAGADDGDGGAPSKPR